MDRIRGTLPRRRRRSLHVKVVVLIAGLGWLLPFAGRATEYPLDRLGEALTFEAFDRRARFKISGTLDLEGYALPQPSPGLVYTESYTLFSPRLTLFLDAQLGSRAYFFAQSRLDRGFDPGERDPGWRLDEYALRVAFGPNRRWRIQAGKFATVVGNWVPRHGSWQNSFITAPLPYENLTGIWDNAAARSSGQLLAWAHVPSVPPSGDEPAEKTLRTPVIWGPGYTSGVAVFGESGRLDAAIEIKNMSLSSDPGTWDLGRNQWQHPVFSGRVGYRPNAMWNLGLSASTGTYLHESARPTLAAGYGFTDYRQTVLAHDIGFAWHHWQVWAEVYAARFAVPRVANADTWAGYLEIKYKLTPRVFGAVRGNWQGFGNIPNGRGGRTPWGREVIRFDVAAGFRPTPHVQAKLQYSLQHEQTRRRRTAHILASQLTVRF